MRNLKLLLLFLFVAIAVGAHTQPGPRLAKAYDLFASDSQLRYASHSLLVIDATTGKIVFDKNSRVGLAPASTQKIITAATAFALMGPDHHFRTELGISGRITNGVLEGNIYIIPSGDPTLGSPRWMRTRDTAVLEEWSNAIRSAGIREVKGSIVFVSERFDARAIPDGWIWQDIGNYYGAASYAVNWKENQYDVLLRSGSQTGAAAGVRSPEGRLQSELTVGKPGSGDNAYVYYNGIIAGTIPPSQSAFSISAAETNPFTAFAADLDHYLGENGIKIIPGGDRARVPLPVIREKPASFQLLHTTLSPALDSMIYWFLRKSINLYGEALVQSLARQMKQVAYTDSGVQVVREFWKQRGLDPLELNLYDGSGLSPMNRVTTYAQVEVLKFARSQKWFASYLDAFPEYNGMKMKSGTIGDVKGFCGYQRSHDGHEYIFSFLVNNYNGSASALVNKMYKVLDLLK